MNQKSNISLLLLTHHLLVLFHLEVVDALRAASLDLFPGQETCSLVSLEDGVGEQLADLVRI